jgi:hypothetical protein
MRSACGSQIRARPRFHHARTPAANSARPRARAIFCYEKFRKKVLTNAVSLGKIAFPGQNRRAELFPTGVVHNTYTTGVRTMAKSCPITRAQFAAKAPANLPCTIDGQPINATPKTFSTGSLGFHANGKVTLKIGGVLVPCQVSLSITAIGSKDLPQDASTPEVQAAPAPAVQDASKPAA